MLKKTRTEVLASLQSKLQNDLNSIYVEDSDRLYYAATNGRYFDQNRDGINTPSESTGWPPEIIELIKRVALATAAITLDAIYTEQELEEKAEMMLLNNNEDS
jgi:hypothetical protein